MKTWQYVVLIVCIIATGLGIVVALNTEKRNTTSTVLQAATVNTIKQAAIDSIKSQAVKDTVEALSYQITRRDKVIHQQAVKITNLTKDFKAAVAAYDKDSIHTPSADTLKATATATINEYKHQTDSMVTTIGQQKQIIVSLTGINSVKDTTIAVFAKNLELIKKECQPTWWDKHQGFFYFGGGFVLGVLPIVFILKK